jgi:hypothetical protein
MENRKIAAVAFALIFLVAITCSAPAVFGARETVTLENADIIGAGATFPEPLYNSQSLRIGHT